MQGNSVQQGVQKCTQRSCLPRIFCHGLKVQRGTPNPLLKFGRGFTSSFPMAINHCITYKESGSHVHAPIQTANTAITVKILQHISWSPAAPASLHPSSLFVQFVLRSTSQLQTLGIPNGLPAISEVGWRCVFFFPFNKKEKNAPGQECS